jgi:hypothetical protein
MASRALGLKEVKAFQRRAHLQSVFPWPRREPLYVGHKRVEAFLSHQIRCVRTRQIVSLHCVACCCINLQKVHVG